MLNLDMKLYGTWGFIREQNKLDTGVKFGFLEWNRIQV